MTPSSSARRSALLATAGAAAALLGACATRNATPPVVAIPPALAAPAGETLQRTLDASGVQIYECRAKAGSADAGEWVFIAPEAQLFDADGLPVGKHYAGPTWESNDGSKVVGQVRAQAGATEAGAIPWLLLATHSTGGPGAFADVTSVQRVATSGGAAPTAGCTASVVGQQVRVPYKAQYTQYARKG
jgi:hypothetical protein